MSREKISLEVDTAVLKQVDQWAKRLKMSRAEFMRRSLSHVVEDERILLHISASPFFRKALMGLGVRVHGEEAGDEPLGAPVK